MRLTQSSEEWNNHSDRMLSIHARGLEVGSRKKVALKQLPPELGFSITSQNPTSGQQLDPVSIASVQLWATIYKKEVSHALLPEMQL